MCQLLIECRRLKVTNSILTRIRDEQRQDIVENLQDNLDKSIQGNQPVHNRRLKFLNQFYLFNGLSKYYEHLLKRCNAGLLEYTDEWKIELERNIKIMSQNMESNEMDLMKAFNCDPSWPVCLYDFTYKNSCN